MAIALTGRPGDDTAAACAQSPMHRTMQPAAVGALLMALAAVAAQPAVAQQPPACAASGWMPLRSAEEVIAAVRQARCAPGSRLDAGMTIAGQAVQLQTSGICEPGSVRTRSVRPTPDNSILGFTCTLAAR